MEGAGIVEGDVVSELMEEDRSRLLHERDAERLKS